MVIGKRFYWPKIREDVKHLFTLVLSTKIPSPFTKKNMDFIKLYQSLLSHGIMCPWTS
jgi:hypothetical protein